MIGDQRKIDKAERDQRACRDVQPECARERFRFVLRFIALAGNRMRKSTPGNKHGRDAKRGWNGKPGECGVVLSRLRQNKCDRERADESAEFVQGPMQAEAPATA